MSKQRLSISCFILSFIFFFGACDTHSAPSQSISPSPLPTIQNTGTDEKTVLRLGMLQSVQSEINSQTIMEQNVLRYNLSQDDYEIVIDYYGESNSSDALSAMAAALLSTEHAPDLLMVEGIPYISYATQGFLMNLYDFFEEDCDTGISKSDFFQGPLQALETDGQLFCLPLTFSLTYLYGSYPVFGDIPYVDTNTLFETWLRYKDTGLNVLPGFYGKLNIFSKFTLPVFSQKYINYTENTCAFDSPECIHDLELYNSLPLEETPISLQDIYPNALYYAYVQEQCSLIGWEFLSSYVNYLLFRTYTNASIPVEIPCSDGAQALCKYVAPLSITTCSKNKEAAWDFISYCLAQSNSGIPMTRSRMDKTIQSEGYYDKWAVYEASGENVEALQIDIPNIYDASTRLPSIPFTREVYQAFLDLLDQKMCPDFSIGTIDNRIQSEVDKIILSEVELYFNGKATAEQTAQAIQTRVELYLAEQS